MLTSRNTEPRKSRGDRDNAEDQALALTHTGGVLEQRPHDKKLGVRKEKKKILNRGRNLARTRKPIIWGEILITHANGIRLETGTHTSKKKKANNMIGKWAKKHEPTAMKYKEAFSILFGIREV